MGHHRDDITHHRKRMPDETRNAVGYAYAEHLLKKYHAILEEFRAAVVELRHAGVPRPEAATQLRARFAKRMPAEARLIANRHFIAIYMMPGPGMCK